MLLGKPRWKGDKKKLSRDSFTKERQAFSQTNPPFSLGWRRWRRWQM